MDHQIRNAIFKAAASEPYARGLAMKLIELDTGHSVVEMIYTDAMHNMFGKAHGGAVFSLIDEAFETAGQTCGTVVVALNVNVTYISSPKPGACLRAKADEITCTRKTAVYDINVTDEDGILIAACRALAYRTGKPLPFLKDP